MLLQLAAAVYMYSILHSLISIATFQCVLVNKRNQLCNCCIILFQIQERQDDPLVYHHGIKAKWTLATIDAQRLIQRRVPEIKIPLLTLHGTDDTTVSIASSQFLMGHSGSEDKSMKVSVIHYLIKIVI